MMRTGLRILGCHSGEAVMIGDRMDTDVISGMESGMSTVLVLSGVSTRATLDEFAYRPSVVLDGVGDIRGWRSRGACALAPGIARRMRCFLTIRTMTIPFLHPLGRNCVECGGSAAVSSGGTGNTVRVK